MPNGPASSDDLLSAFRDGELTGAEADAAARLLEESADARSEVEDYQALSELLRPLAGEKAPDGLRAAVMRRIERESLLTAAPSEVRGRRRSRRFWVFGTLLAGSVAALVVAFGRFSDSVRPAGDRTVADARPAASAADRAPSPRGEAVGGGFGGGRGTGLGDGLVPGLAASNGTEKFGMAGVDAPPAGALPGDSYSYTDVTENGRVMVVEATVVDVNLALNQLQYLLAKNSIEPQAVSTEEFQRHSDAPAADGSGDAELGVLVVSDPAQIEAALKEAGRQSHLFVNLQLAGVYASETTVRDKELAPLALAERRAFGPAVDAVREELEGRGMRSSAGAAAGQARASVRTDLPKRGGEPSQVLENDSRSFDSHSAEPKDEKAGADPSAATSAADSVPPDAVEKSATLNYQQIVNVSRADVERRLNESPDNLGRRDHQLSDLPYGGAAGLPESQDWSFGDANAGQQNGPAAGSLEQESTRFLKQHGQRRLKMLVLLQATDASRRMKTATDPPSRLPVEAPQPVRKKG